jgi:predicted dehydrogenase
MIHVAIIGAGLIGKKRAIALPKGVTLVAVVDPDKKRREAFAKEFSCGAYSSFEEVVCDSNVHAIFICTPNSIASQVASLAIKNGKHVLLEKPGAKGLVDFKKIEQAYLKNQNVVVAFGYNHRYHPALLRAKKIIESKKYGKVLFIRAKYGHGGRLGYDKEWRFQKNISGGGHLMDQGTHLIDFVNFFAGKLAFKSAQLKTLFWDTELEDSAFLLLEKNNIVAQLSTSCVEWKNIFCFEIMLTTAKLQIDGLGRSYGTEKLRTMT